MARLPAFLLLAALAVLPAATGCLGGDVYLVASAPMESNGITLAVATSGLVDGDKETLRFDIFYNEKRVYPPYGIGGELVVEGGRGSTFVPYSKFVVGNGDYEVAVRGDSGSARAMAVVTKWVQSVYLKPYMKGNTLVVDAILQSAHGGRPQDRVIAEGDLRLDIRYRGPDGSLNQTAHTEHMDTNPHRTFTRFSLLANRMDNYKGPGYYSIHAKFDNLQARGNTWVPNDPTMRYHDPPEHWVYVD